MDHLSRAIAIVGGVGKLARKCKVSYQAVQKWRKNGVPWKRCHTIEEITAGFVTCSDLRPDIFRVASNDAAEQLPTRKERRRAA